MSTIHPIERYSGLIKSIRRTVRFSDKYSKQFKRLRADLLLCERKGEHFVPLEEKTTSQRIVVAFCTEEEWSGLHEIPKRTPESYIDLEPWNEVIHIRIQDDWIELHYAIAIFSSLAMYDFLRKQVKKKKPLTKQVIARSKAIRTLAAHKLLDYHNDGAWSAFVKNNLEFSKRMQLVVDQRNYVFEPTPDALSRISAFLPHGGAHCEQIWKDSLSREVFELIQCKDDRDFVNGKIFKSKHTPESLFQSFLENRQSGNRS